MITWCSSGRQALLETLMLCISCLGSHIYSRQRILKLTSSHGPERPPDLTPSTHVEHQRDGRKISLKHVKTISPTPSSYMNIRATTMLDIWMSGVRDRLWRATDQSLVSHESWDSTDWKHGWAARSQHGRRAEISSLSINSLNLVLLYFNRRRKVHKITAGVSMTWQKKRHWDAS